MNPDIAFQIPDRLPPQNVDAEGEILGGILLDPEAIGRIADILPPQAFYTSAHKRIYRAALALYTQEKPTDLTSVVSWLCDRNLLDKVGGHAKLVRLVDRTVSAVNIDQYAALVKDKFLRRQLISISQKISHLAYESMSPLSEILDAAEREMLDVTQDRASNGLTPVSDILINTFAEIEERFAGVSIAGTPCNFYDLDAMTQGLQRSDLIIVAGRPSMGKTSFVMNIAQNIAALHNLPALIFSLEMSKEQLVYRMLASEVGIDSSMLRSGNIQQYEFEPLSQAIGTLSERPIYIDDSPNISVMEMRSKARRLQAEHGGKSEATFLSHTLRSRRRSGYLRRVGLGGGFLFHASVLQHRTNPCHHWRMS